MKHILTAQSLEEILLKNFGIKVPPRTTDIAIHASYDLESVATITFKTLVIYDGECVPEIRKFTLVEMKDDEVASSDRPEERR